MTEERNTHVVADITLSGETVSIGYGRDDISVSMDTPTVHMSVLEAKLLISALWCAVEALGDE